MNTHNLDAFKASITPHPCQMALVRSEVHVEAQLPQCGVDTRDAVASAIQRNRQHRPLIPPRPLCRIRVDRKVFQAGPHGMAQLLVDRPEPPEGRHPMHLLGPPRPIILIVALEPSPLALARLSEFIRGLLAGALVQRLVPCGVEVVVNLKLAFASALPGLVLDCLLNIEDFGMSRAKCHV